ncbi:MAG TPA: ferritin-like domain-containing protein [Solirubrobacteraceae bacterium]|jgi:ferritin-like metal-binding protein YciE|nr:ferritin-like domain-containing protein [Solirubrobacteraceae bacterium]
MSRSARKIVQYLNEAYAAEIVQRRAFQAQIATAAPGRYRMALERHLKETVRHAERLAERLAELGESRGPLQVGIGTAATLASQLVNIGRAPFGLVRAPAAEERVLHGARDLCAAEAAEIATYAAIERLARDADDRRTAKLAAWIRADEEAMLKRLLTEIPGLTHAVALASFDVVPPKAITRTAGTGRDNAGNGSSPVARDPLDPHATDRPVHRPGGAAAESSVVVRRARSSASSPAAGEPWAGYDRLSAVEIIAALDGASAARVKRARAYERAGKRRSTVIQATERELARS